MSALDLEAINVKFYFISSIYWVFFYFVSSFVSVVVGVAFLTL